MSFSLQDTKAGIKLNGVQVNKLQYADDFCLLIRSGTWTTGDCNMNRWNR